MGRADERRQEWSHDARGATTNTVSGAPGNVVQAGTVYGGVHFWSASGAVPLKAVVPAPPDAVVERPELSERVITELLREDHDQVVALCGLTGTGGFGKTTLASVVAYDPRVRERFVEGIAWLTLGEQLEGPGLLSKVNDLATRMSGAPASFSDLEQASQHLGTVLAAQRCLLVIDDVWRDSQLAPFRRHISPPTRLLVTTRRRHVLGKATRVPVDVMTSDQARALLSEGLPRTAAAVWEPLLAPTGRWPVLLSLANRAVYEAVEDGEPLADAVERFAGLLAVRITALDLEDEDERQLAVRRTVDASLSTVGTREPNVRERFLELAVFPEDAAIPQDTLERYWHRTAGLDVVEVEKVCRELSNRSLVQGRETGTRRRLWLHDVIGSYLHTSAGEHLYSDRLAEYQHALLQAYRTALPSDQGITEWWHLPDEEPYLWRHLAYHLHHAGLEQELNDVICDIRWILAVLHRYGPVDVESDLAYATSPLAATLHEAIARNASVLASLASSNGLTSTLLASLSPHPELAEYIAASAKLLTRPYLLPTHPLPEPPHPALKRVLTGDTHGSAAVAISPDGTWLATSGDRTVRLWNTDGTERTTFTNHEDRVSAVAISPDGTWLASASNDGTVRLWDADGAERTTFTAHTGRVYAVAISPDGTWLATTSGDHTVRLWHADGTERTTFTNHTGPVYAAAISPDGTWLASASNDETLRLWNTDGTERATFAADTGPVWAVAISPDGTWLASASGRGTVRLWDTDGTERVTFTGHARPVSTVAISPDGTWLATGGWDRTVRLWHTDGTERAQLPGLNDRVSALAISPDGTWLASSDRMMRLWSTDGIGRDIFASHTDQVSAVATSPDGTWLATGGWDRTVRLWDADGTERAVLTGHTGRVYAVAVSPDGTWLASASDDGTVRLLNTDGTDRTTFTAHTGPVYAVAISPDGTWLATAGVQVRLWNTDGTERGTFTGHTGPVSAVAISPDGTWLASASNDGTVRLWNTDGTERATFTGHNDRVAAVAINPDGTWLASASDRGTVRLSNTDGTERARLTGLNDRISALEFSPDGTWLATGSRDGAVGVWNTASREKITLVRVDPPVRGIAWLPANSGFIVHLDSALLGFRLVLTPEARDGLTDEFPLHP